MVDVGDDCDIARFCHNPILAELVALFVMITDEYLRHNAEYAPSHQGALPLLPSKQVAVVACMDARLDVYRMLGIALGRVPGSYGNQYLGIIGRKRLSIRIIGIHTRELFQRIVIE